MGKFSKTHRRTKKRGGMNFFGISTEKKKEKEAERQRVEEERLRKEQEAEQQRKEQQSKEQQRKEQEAAERKERIETETSDEKFEEWKESSENIKNMISNNPEPKMGWKNYWIDYIVIPGIDGHRLKLDKQSDTYYGTVKDESDGVWKVDPILAKKNRKIEVENKIKRLKKKIDRDHKRGDNLVKLKTELQRLEEYNNTLNVGGKRRRTRRNQKKKSKKTHHKKPKKSRRKKHNTRRKRRH